jgi:hydroxyacid-oxoacid transhydrogenase
MIENPSDDDARDQMMMAASFGRVGIGNAGVHLPHAMSYPVSCMVREYIPEGYSPDHPIIPHGMSVALNAPSAFRFTAKANPERHLHAAELMGVDVSNAHPNEAGELLASAIVNLMHRTGIPKGLSAVGYGPEDVPKLVAGTLAQERVTRLSPRSVTEADLRQLFIGNMTHW